VGINKKIEKREARRELKAEAAARLEMSIEKELLTRLRQGVYGESDIMNESQEAFKKALDELEQEEEYESEEVFFFSYSRRSLENMFQILVRKRVTLRI
jgi:protein MAK16